MAKLQQKTNGQTANGEPKIMDKIHYGLDVKTGVDGYNAIKTVVKTARANGFSANDRTVIMAMAGELNPKFDNALKIVESTITEMVAEFVQQHNENEIANLIVG